MAISVSQTASFDADLAREVGLPAAILYNQLLYTSQTDMVKHYDKDGWFYYTAETFEDRTTYNKDTLTRAVKTLVDAGYIIKKRMYIKNSTISVNHFQFVKYYVPNYCETRVGAVSSNESCLYKEKYKENEPEIADFPTASSDPAPTSDLTEETERGAKGGVVKITTPDPFSGEVKDVKPKKDMLTPKAYALAAELMPIIDPNDRDKVTTARLIKNALVAGYTPEQLRYVARASRSDDWYYNKPCTTVLRSDGIKELLAKQKKKEGGGHPSWRGLSPY